MTHKRAVPTRSQRTSWLSRAKPIHLFTYITVRLSVALFVTLDYWCCPYSMRSIDRQQQRRPVCCWAPCGQEISIDSWGRAEGAVPQTRHAADEGAQQQRAVAGAGAQQHIRAASRYQPKEEACYWGVYTWSVVCYRLNRIAHTEQRSMVVWHSLLAYICHVTYTAIAAWNNPPLKESHAALTIIYSQQLQKYAILGAYYWRTATIRYTHWHVQYTLYSTTIIILSKCEFWTDLLW